MLSFWGVLYLGARAASPSLCFSLAKWDTSWNHIICACIANHSVNNWVTKNCESLHACGCLSSQFTSLQAALPFSLVEGEEESRLKRVGIVKAPLLNLLGHISAWLLLFAFVFWAVFFNHPCLSLLSSFDLLLPLLTALFFSQFLPPIFLLSLSSTPLPPRGQSIGPESCW